VTAHINLVSPARQIVPFANVHVPTFTAWLNALPDNDVWTEDSVRDRSTQDQAYDPALMFAVEQDSEPVGFLLSSIVNQAGWVFAFMVHPDWRRQGIGTLMFDAMERTLAERAITEINVGWAPLRYFLPGIDIRSTSAIVFLDGRGYETKRETRVNMDVQLQGRSFDTSESKARLRAQGIAIRRGQPADRPGITRLCEAYGNPIWVIESGRALDRDPVTLFVAETMSEICAFAAYGVGGPLFFGPMLTDADRRGMGIGSVLLKHCLQDWQRLGTDSCEILWAGPLSFYARSVGATVGRAFWTFHKSL
jgi:GNAT superfamily N-acetyltransferase